MSQFGTPGCRVYATTVHSAGVARNLVVADQVMTLFVHAWVDPALKVASPFGIWVVNWDLIGVPDPPGDTPQHRSFGWSGFLKNIPGNSAGYLNPSVTFQLATHFTDGEQGYYLYRPHLFIRVGGGFQNYQFTFAEEPHYILITDGT